MARALLLSLAIALAGCAGEPVYRDVEIPVPQIVRPPDRLLRQIQPPADAFVAPEDDRALIALSPEGKLYLGRLLERQRLWRAWVNALDEQALSAGDAQSGLRRGGD